MPSRFLPAFTRVALWLLTSLSATLPAAETLPFSTVFKGQKKFESLMKRAKPNAQRLQQTLIGERTAWFGQALIGTPYKSFTLEIDDHIEAPSVNLDGLDCWTFFEVSLALARLTSQPTAQWTPQSLLRLIELDRYWGGRCNGSYLSRLHYLEDWTADNEKRGLVKDLTRQLGGTPVRNAAREMTVAWKGYRYMVNSAANRAGIAQLEEGLRSRPMFMIPLAQVPKIEAQLQNGDVISIVSKDRDAFATSHVGLAFRQDGVLRFMHASSPRNFGKVVLDSRLSDYLKRYKTHAGIMVARPLR
jgi:hypothetical protein